MDNPFKLDYSDQKDTDLAELGIKGDKNALQGLIMRHQIFVYNLALKMSNNKQDAEVLTQEVFIKAITTLSQFKEEGSLRIWLYRILADHFLQSKKRGTESQINDFETYFDSIEKVPVHKLSKSEEKDLADTIEEIRINCTTGMLLCLSREQRLLYVLGEIFEANDELVSHLLEIPEDNYRLELNNTRKDLYDWMNKKCGLINTDNPCRCAEKTKGYMDAGIVDPYNLQFNTTYKSKISVLTDDNATAISDSIDTLNKKVFQGHPLQESERASKIMNEVFNFDFIKSILNI